jgi:hypothetical protein
MTNVHGIQQPTSVSNGTTTTTTTITTTNTNTKNQIINTGIKRPLTNGNTTTVRLKQTPQVQLRVTCQVCKKV